MSPCAGYCGVNKSLSIKSIRPAEPRERNIYFKSHTSGWEHSSHFRLIGRGVPSASVVSQLVYKFLCVASPKENPQVNI